MCSLDRIETPGYLCEAETKTILERCWCSVTQLTAMVCIAWKEDFEWEGACMEMRSRSRAKDLMDLCISSCAVTHDTSQVGREFQSCTIHSCNTTLGTCGKDASRPGAVTPAPVTCPRNPDTWVLQGTAAHTPCVHRQRRWISKSISQRYHFACQQCGYDFERWPLRTQRQALFVQVLDKVLWIIFFSAFLQPLHHTMGRTVLLVTSAHACIPGGYCSCSRGDIST